MYKINSVLSHLLRSVFAVYLSHVDLTRQRRIWRENNHQFIFDPVTTTTILPIARLSPAAQKGSRCPIRIKAVISSQWVPHLHSCAERYHVTGVAMATRQHWITEVLFKAPFHGRLFALNGFLLCSVWVAETEGTVCVRACVCSSAWAYVVCLLCATLSWGDKSLKFW